MDKIEAVAMAVHQSLVDVDDDERFWDDLDCEAQEGYREVARVAIEAWKSSITVDSPIVS